MPHWRRIVAVVVAFVAFGVLLPCAAFAWLGAHYEPAYALDDRHPVAPRRTIYPDTSIVTIFRAQAPEAAIRAYVNALHPVRSSTSTLRGYTQADAELGNGRVVRVAGIGDVVFAFVAPSAAVLERRIAQTPGILRNRRRDVGNAVFDDHLGAAIGLAAAWFVAWFAVTTIVTMRLAMPTPTPPRPGTVAVEPDELARRLLALGDGTHPFVVAAGNRAGELFVDWRYDTAWTTAFAADREKKLFRIRLRLDPATHTVDSTDFETQFDVSGGALPEPFSISWKASRGYVFAEREVGIVGGKTYRFDVRELRDPVVATITEAGWTYRPRL